MVYFTASLISVFITVSLIPLMTRFASSFQLVDFPNPRKVHTCPVPRVGGLAIAVGSFIPVIFWAETDNFVKAYLAGAGTLVLFGLIDDMKGLGYKAKFAGQVIAALAVVFFGGVTINSLGALLPGTGQLPGWFAVFLSVIAIVGVTNAINLADGLDGLAGGISLLGFCCIGYLAYLSGNNAAILLSLSLAGAIFGFLRYNTHPASLFMGDTGSQLLGFSAAVLAIKITQGENPLSPVLPLIILGFPILDTLTVMIERVRAGRSPFAADKNHFHHRLIRLGLSHAEAVFAIYVIQSIMILAAVLFKYNDWILVTSYAVFSAFIISAFIIADRAGFAFKRHPLIEREVKDRLRRIRDSHWMIKLSLAASMAAIPLMFLVSCALPAKVPGYMGAIAFCFGLAMLSIWIFARQHMSSCLRFAVYLTIPPVLYLIQQGRVVWASEEMLRLYQISFGIIAVFVLLTLRFNRRTKGFRMTTMDFLVIFIAVLVPNLPDPSIRSYHLGLLAVEIIVLLFGYEVLISELRGRLNALAATTLAGLMLLGIRGVLK